MTEAEFKCPIPHCGYAYPRKWAVERHIARQHKMTLKLDALRSEPAGKSADMHRKTLAPPFENPLRLTSPPIPHGTTRLEDKDPLDERIEDLDKMEKCTRLLQKIRYNTQFPAYQQPFAAPRIRQEPVRGFVGLTCRYCTTFQIKPFYTSPLETTEAIDLTRQHHCIRGADFSYATNSEWQSLHCAMSVRMSEKIDLVVPGDKYLYAVETRTIPPSTPPLIRDLIRANYVSDLANERSYIYRAIVGGYTPLDTSELQDFTENAEATYTVCPVRRNGESKLNMLHIGPVPSYADHLHHQGPK